MHIERARIRTFRNLADVDLRLDPSSAIVGENRSGQAQSRSPVPAGPGHLTVDHRPPTRPRRLMGWARRQSQEWELLAEGHLIEVCLNIVDVQGNARVLAELADALPAGATDLSVRTGGHGR